MTSPRLQWLALVLKERFGNDFILEENDGSLQLKLPDCSGGVVFDSLLCSFLSAPDLPFTTWNAQNEGWQAMLESPLPAPGTLSLPAPLIELRGDRHFIHYDILGLAYWMFARVEELGRIDLDRHGRFPATASHAFKHGYLERPIVDEWLHVLGQVMQRQWPGIRLHAPVSRTFISCDVDNPYESYVKNWRRTFRKCSGDVARRRSLQEAARTIENYVRSAKGDYSADQNDTFDWMMDVNERAGNRMTFYFLVDQTFPQYDAHYSINEPRIRALMRRIHARGHEIGLHGSYGTYKNGLQIKKEVDLLRKVMEQERINQAEIGARQHYLRWSSPETAKHLDNAGLTYDTSLSYADRPGFRCGTCHEYPMFDLSENKQLNIRERPLILMECSAIASFYMGLGYEPQSIEYMKSLKQLCQKFGGDFTLLWHNSHFRTKMDKHFYQELIS